MFERTTLAEGPRVISTRLPGARSVSVAAFVRAGSRLESREQAGMAHFLEHLTFKGTEAYPSTRSLSEAIEGVGGSFNAATDPPLTHQRSLRASVPERAGKLVEEAGFEPA